MLSYVLIIKQLLARRLVSESEIFALVAGKNVAVVGNAQSLGQTAPGGKIDQFDVVVRFNFAGTAPDASLGKKTTILVLATELAAERIHALSPRLLFWVSSKRRKMGSVISSGIPTAILSGGTRKRLFSNFPGRPSSGFMLLSFLLRSEARSVRIFGFDFYQSGSTSGNQTKDSTPHDYDHEENAVRQMLNSDERFVICR